MQPTTAQFILQSLARQGLVEVKMTTFRVPKYPQPVDLRDVRESFKSLSECIGYPKGHLILTLGSGLEAWCHEKLFEKLFKIVFINQKVFPVSRTSNTEGFQGRDLPLPTLFIGSEKTQVRQIPLSETRPWPFKFLLELGGMIVCRAPDRKDFLKELRQFVNNYPQYEIGVDAKEWPDGNIAVFTWWFRKLPRVERKGNVNVPS